MLNTLTGMFYTRPDPSSPTVEVREAYHKQADPCLIYRQDKAGRWREYGAKHFRAGRTFYRFVRIVK